MLHKIISFLFFSILLFPANQNERLYDSAMYYFRINDTNQSYILFSQLISNGYKTDVAFCYRGIVNYDMDMIPNAISDFTKSISINKTNIIPYSYLTWIYIEKNDYKKALEYNGIAYKLCSTNPNILYHRTRLYAETKQYDKALKYNDELYTISSNKYYRYFIPAIIDFTQEKYSYAITNLNIALKYNYDTEYWPCIMLGVSHLITDNVDDAIPVLEKAVRYSKTVCYTYLLYQLALSKKSFFFNRTASLNKLHANIMKEFIETNDWHYRLTKHLDNEINYEALSTVATNNEMKNELFTYHGYNMIFNNQTEQARQYFQKCTNLGISNSYEYLLSKYEINNLDKK